MGPDVIVAALAGFAGGVALSVLGRQRLIGPGRRGYHIRWDGPAAAPLRRQGEQPHPAEMARLFRHAELIRPVSGSPLRRVVGVGATAATDDLAVELIAVELRESGGRCYVRFRSPRGALAVLGEPDLAVADDLGTGYEIGLAGMSSSSEGGDATFVFAPRPPDAARSLAVSVERFHERDLQRGPGRPGPRGDVVGPWRFAVGIDGR